MSDSLNPSIKLAELLIIKRYFDLLVKLTRSLCAEVKTNIMPYCSLFCCEAITYFNKTIRKVDISQAKDIARTKNLLIDFDSVDFDSNNALEVVCK